MTSLPPTTPKKTPIPASLWKYRGTHSPTLPPRQSLMLLRGGETIKSFPSVHAEKPRDSASSAFSLMTWQGSKGHFCGQGLLDTMTQITQMPPSFCPGDLSQPGLFLRTADVIGPAHGRLVSSEFSGFLGPVERGRKFLSEDGEDVTEEGQVLALWGQKGNKGAQMEAGRTRGSWEVLEQGAEGTGTQLPLRGCHSSWRVCLEANLGLVNGLDACNAVWPLGTWNFWQKFSFHSGCLSHLWASWPLQGPDNRKRHRVDEKGRERGGRQDGAGPAGGWVQALHGGASVPAETRAPGPDPHSQAHCAFSLGGVCSASRLPAGQAIRARPEKKLHCIRRLGKLSAGCFLHTGPRPRLPLLAHLCFPWCLLSRRALETKVPCVCRCPPRPPPAPRPHPDTLRRAPTGSPRRQGRARPGTALTMAGTKDVSDEHPRA